MAAQLDIKPLKCASYDGCSFLLCRSKLFVFLTPQEPLSLPEELGTEFVATISSSSATLQELPMPRIRARRMIFDPVNRDLFTGALLGIGTPTSFISCGSHETHAFAVNTSSGDLNSITPPFIASSEMLADVQGRFLFDAHCQQNSTGVGLSFRYHGGIDVWRINGGQFSLVPGSPFGLAAAPLAEDRAGKFVFALGPLTFPTLVLSPTGTVEVYSIQADGSPTRVSSAGLPGPLPDLGNPSPVAGRPPAMALGVDGSHLYVGYLPDYAGTEYDIALFRVDQQSGALSYVTSYTTPKMLSLVIHPSGNFLYALAGAFPACCPVPQGVLVFPINGDGTLGNPATISTPIVHLAFDPSGRYAFADAQDNQTLQWRLDLLNVDLATGNLTAATIANISARSNSVVVVPSQ